MNVLAIDTAGPVIGVALVTPAWQGARQERVTRGAEALLIPWAQELCQEAQTTLQELDAVGVSRGPGAFTGIRVGMATAMGLSVSLGVPLVGRCSLHHRAPEQGRGLALLDARKQRVYAGWYQDGAAAGEPVDIAPAELLASVTGPFLASGEGAVVYRALVEAAGGVVVDSADDSGVLRLAQQVVRAGVSGRDAAAVQPLYVRAPDAKTIKEREAARAAKKRQEQACGSE